MTWFGRPRCHPLKNICRWKQMQMMREKVAVHCAVVQFPKTTRLPFPIHTGFIMFHHFLFLFNIFFQICDSFWPSLEGPLWAYFGASGRGQKWPFRIRHHSNSNIFGSQSCPLEKFMILNNLF